MNLSVSIKVIAIKLTENTHVHTPIFIHAVFNYGSTSFTHHRFSQEIMWEKHKNNFMLRVCRKSPKLLKDLTQECVYVNSLIYFVIDLKYTYTQIHTCCIPSLSSFCNFLNYFSVCKQLNNLLLNTGCKLTAQRHAWPINKLYLIHRLFYD